MTPERAEQSVDMASVHEMIQMVYQVAIDPSRFDELIASWDCFFDATKDTPQAAVMARHFEQAERIANDPRLDRAHNLEVILDLVAAPALLVNAAGKLVSTNAAGRLQIGNLAPGHDIAASFIGDWRDGSWRNIRQFQLRTDQNTVLFAAADPVPLAGDESPVYLIRLEANQWSRGISDILRQTYQLTDTEIEIARALHGGKSLADIALERNRSPETVRSQLKAVLAKTGAGKQAGLLQRLSHLQYLANTKTPAPGAPAAAMRRSGFHLGETRAADGRRLVYSVYGAAQGHQLFYLTTSSCPEETPEWREAIAASGLRVIALHRPGFGGSEAPGKKRQSLLSLAEDCAAVLEPLASRPLLFAGHREAGILAAQVAPLLQFDLAELDIRGVALVSTGVPGDQIEQNASATSTMRRSVSASRSFPSALRLGYRAAKRVFDTGQIGERQMVSYFTRSSPIDRALIRDPYYWTLLRDNIRYCFQDTDTIVDDIALWTSAWNADMAERSEHAIPWHFIQGRDHDFLAADAARIYCDTHPNSQLKLVSNTAQLMLYQRPELVASYLARCFGP